MGYRILLGDALVHELEESIHKERNKKIKGEDIPITINEGEEWEIYRLWRGYHIKHQICDEQDFLKIMHKTWSIKETRKSIIKKKKKKQQQQQLMEKCGIPIELGKHKNY